MNSNTNNTVTCSFVMDRDTYNAFKSIVSRHGENVKGNIVRYMQSVIKYDTSNADTILAIQEVQALKKSPDKKVYANFSEILEEKTAKKRGYDLSLLDDVVDTLAKGLPLDQKYKDHNLIGNYKGCRECHITPDWLLIYEIDNNELILYLTRTGTHSDLF